MRGLLILLLLALCAGCQRPPSAPPTPPAAAPPRVHFGYELVGNVSVFYREAGPRDAPTVLLLHGFPSSSHQYRGLIDALATRLHVVAPDYPGFGFTHAPADFAYTFDNVARVIERFCAQRALTHVYVYMFDFGAPVGFRVALRHPDWIAGIITQNGNAHLHSIAPEIVNMIHLDARTDPERARAVRLRVLDLEATKSQYVTGAEKPHQLAPEAWTLDQHFLDRPERREAMLALLDDYKSNVAAYPRWQEYLRSRRPKTLIVWGKNDPIFLASGALAWKRDVPDAELHLLSGGHFLLEERAPEVAQLIREFVLTAN